MAKVTWAEVKRYFETTHGDDAHFNTGCAGEADLELEKGQALATRRARLIRQLFELEPGGGRELAHPGRRRRARGTMRQCEAAA